MRDRGRESGLEGILARGFPTKGAWDPWCTRPSVRSKKPRTRTVPLEPALISEVENGISEARQAVEANDVDRIRKAEKQLTQIGRRLTETLYKNTTDSGQNGKASDVPPGAPGSEEDVVDAEYQDVV